MKKILFFVVCLGWTAAAYSQFHALTKAAYPSSVAKTIVREYQYPTTISYVETVDSHYFAYADQSLGIINCTVDPDIFVRDFAVHKNMVYFCGVYSSASPKGIFGWFDITTLTNGTLIYHTYQQFACNKYSVDTLNAITVFDSWNGMHAVVVGSATDNASSVNGCTIDINNNNGGPGAWTYSVGITPGHERITHVCQTSNYIVTSGLTADPRFEVYRRHRKINIFTPGGIEDELWMFVMSNSNPGTRSIEQFAITPTHNDIVATAIRADHISGTHEIQVYAHDMNNPVLGSTSPLFSCYQNTLTSTLDVNALRYDAVNDALVLLLSSDNLIYPITGSGSIVTEIPIISSTTVPYTMHVLNGIKLTSLDLYRSQLNILCQGMVFGSYNQTFTLTQPLNTTAQCASNVNLNGYYKSYMTKNAFSPYTICQGIVSFSTHYSACNIFTNNAFICHP